MSRKKPLDLEAFATDLGGVMGLAMPALAANPPTTPAGARAAGAALRQLSDILPTIGAPPHAVAFARALAVSIETSCGHDRPPDVK